MTATRNLEDRVAMVSILQTIDTIRSTIACFESAPSGAIRGLDIAREILTRPRAALKDAACELTLRASNLEGDNLYLHDCSEGLKLATSIIRLRIDLK
jgi:hypothetical protein